MEANTNASCRRIAVVGTCSFDYVLRIDEFPSEDHKYMCDLNKGRCGGVAANIAVNLALLGIPATLVSWIGYDNIGRTIRSCVEGQGVSTDGLTSATEDTPRVFILACERTGSRTAFMTKHKRPTLLTESQEKQIADCSIIYYDGSWPEVGESIFRLRKSTGALVFVNYELPSPSGLRAFLSADFAVASDQALCEDKIRDWKQLEAQLANLWRSNKRYIGVTMGKLGSLFFDGNGFFHTPAISVNEVDTTGAGDAFQAGLLLGLLRNWDLQFSIQFATSLGALKCTYAGSNFSSAGKADIEKEALDLSHKIPVNPEQYGTNNIAELEDWNTFN